RRRGISASGAPPPATTRGSRITSLTTHNASCKDLSASSTNLSLPPRTRMVTAFGFLHPSMKTILSSATFFSSTIFAYPRSLDFRSSRLLITLAPVALDRKSTRLNSSHGSISYAVFCLKKKKIIHHHNVESVSILSGKIFLWLQRSTG